MNTRTLIYIFAASATALAYPTDTAPTKKAATTPQGYVTALSADAEYEYLPPVTVEVVDAEVEINGVPAQ